MRNAIAYEWRRAVSLRSTWTLLATAVGVAGFFSWVMYKTYDSATPIVTDGPDISEPVATKIPITALVNNINGPYLMVTIIIAVFAAMTWGHEYRYGVARLTFASFPRRFEVFGAKLVSIVGFTVVAWAATLAVSLSVIKAFDSDGQVDFGLSQSVGAPSGPGVGVEIQRAAGIVPTYESSAGQSLLRSLAYAVVLALIVGALAALTRSLPISIILALLMPLFVERLLLALSSVLPGGGLKWLNDVAPFDNGERFVAWVAGYDTTKAGDIVNIITPWQAGMVFGAWAVMLSALAYLLIERRDA